MKTKKVPKWKLKKQKGGAMDVDKEKEAEDPAQVKIRDAVNAITGAADQLLTRGQTEIYEQEREMLIRQYRREAGEDWVEPPAESQTDALDNGDVKMWEYRWIDGRDGAAKQGPYDGNTMVSWRDAGYFGEGVEFRRVGEDGGWSRVVDFL
jgi:CD2 antigen cytoplasmic tail-binding protein 2